MKIRYTDLSKLAYGINESWYIFNAPRPIHGHKTWKSTEGPTGWFFAAVNPGAEDAELLIDRIKELDGVLLRNYPSNEEMATQVRNYYINDFCMDAKVVDAGMRDMGTQGINRTWLKHVAQRDVEL